MEINYWWLIPFLLLVALLVIWLIKRNQKDEKVFEKKIIQSELKPGDDDHDEPVPH